MKILLSIKPEFALKIFEGSKRYEFRRIIFKRKGIRKVLVYASSPISEIIGEFEIADILSDEPERLWIKTKDQAGISEKKFFHYFCNTNKGYAIKVSNYEMYDKPILLDDLFIASPPQSFMYLE
jgi:predicted transcriptional regulator